MAEFALRPYISVVVAARNDGAAGNMPARMQAFFDSWLDQAKRYSIESEIIVVEWNPPPDRPKLVDELRWHTTDTHPCEVRFIEVPEELHRRFKNAHLISMHSLIAKNVGIRRARGEFVLATNPDIVFSPELMQFFAERRLQPRSLYRTDRCDVAKEIFAYADADQLVAHCATHIHRVLAIEGEFQVASNGLRMLEPEDITSPEEGIRFGTGCYPPESEGGSRFRWLMDRAEILLKRPPDASPCLLLDAETGPSAGEKPVSVEFVSSSGRVLAATNFHGRAQLRLDVPEQISSATLRLEIQSQGLPLEQDPRKLDFRLFGVRWDVSNNLVWKTKRPGSEAGIRVRSVRPRQIQIELNPDRESRLNRLEMKLSDPLGKPLFHTKVDPLEIARASEYLLTLDLGFEAAEATWTPEQQAGVKGHWILDTAQLSETDWSAGSLNVSPCANEVRNSAYLHTNGCGDFTLLARQDWHSLRGYAEFPILPKYVDALFCYSAHHAGMRETILRAPLRIFHLQDFSGSRDKAGSSSGAPALTYERLVKWINEMRRLDAPAIFSQNHWGLGDAELKETIAVNHLKRFS